MGSFNLLVLAAGRGDDPSGIGGIAIIAGIVVALAIAGFVAHLVIHKGYLRNRGTAGGDDEHPPGHVGRL